MKNVFFLCICMFGLLFTSCENDIFAPPDEDSNSEITNRSKDKGDKGDSFADVETNGRWLIFQSKESYQQAYNRLLEVNNSEKANTEKVILTEDEKGDYGTTYDPNPGIALVELEIGHKSLRRAVALEEDLALRAGGDPGIIMRTLDDRDITDVITQSLFSEEGVIQIGSTMFYAATPGLSIEVINNRSDLMIGILDQGTDLIFENGNHENIRLKPKSTFFGVKDCTADFGSFTGVVDEENGTAQFTFLWNLGDIAGAIDPSFTWNFGDGTSETASSPFVYHQYNNLQPNVENNFTVCLTASYTLVDEEGVETMCSNSTCETVSVMYEEDDEPLFTCDDAQIVGSILETIGLINLLNITPTPGNAEQVCLNATNLVLGSAQLLDAIEFSWNFQGQTGEGLQACFIAPCDGVYSITLQISTAEGESCMIIAEDYQHNVEANCEGKKDIQVEESFEYFIGGDRHKVCFRAKHQTRMDNSLWTLNFGKNQVEAEQKSYKKRWVGWKKVSKRHEIRMEGNVYPPGNACFCEGVPDFLDPLIDFRIKTEKKTEYNKQMFPSADGIFCKVNDPYSVTFNENNGSIVQSYDFPQ